MPCHVMPVGLPDSLPSGPRRPKCKELPSIVPSLDVQAIDSPLVMIARFPLPIVARTCWDLSNHEVYNGIASSGNVYRVVVAAEVW